MLAIESFLKSENELFVSDFERKDFRSEDFMQRSTSKGFFGEGLLFGVILPERGVEGKSSL